MEQRTLFSGTASHIGVTLDSEGTLVIAGTAYNDTITIQTTSAGTSVTAYAVTKRTSTSQGTGVSSIRKKLPAGAVKFIRVDGGSGHDALTVDEATVAIAEERRFESTTVVTDHGVGVAANMFSTDPEPGSDNGSTDAWMARFNRQIKANAHAHPKTIFIGDSLMERLPTTDPADFKKLQRQFSVTDLGFSGDTTSRLLYRLKHGVLGSMSPKLVFLSIGTNNVGLTDDVNSTVRGIQAVIDELHRQLPHAKIVLSSILPRGELGDDAFAPSINAQLASLTKQQGLGYVDATSLFSKSQFKISDFEHNSAHLKLGGYQLWVPAIADGLLKALDT